MAEESRNELIHRLIEVERAQAVTTSDIRGIFAGLDEIRAVLTRMQENNKPNLGGLFLALIATLSFFLTVGGLSLAPLYRDLSRIDSSMYNIQEYQRGILGSRFTDQDGKEMREDAEDHYRRYEQQLLELTREIGELKGKQE